MPRFVRTSSTLGRRVCVIGAGVSGLVTAKVLRADGFAVTVFEMGNDIGGTWARSRTYPGLRANNSRSSYAFSDFSYAPTTDEFPTAEQVHAYLCSYVDAFSLAPHIVLGTQVTNVSAGATAGAPLSVHTRCAGVAAAPEFDHVVVCNGVFAVPAMPVIDGRDAFAGAVVHSSELTDLDLADGKRVVVVGAGKSALDCAAAVAPRARSCTLVFRAPHWMVPRYFPGGVPADRVLLSRLTELLLPPYHTRGAVTRLLHRCGAPALRALWRMQSRRIGDLLDLPPDLRPAQPLPAGIESVGVDDGFGALVRSGAVRAKRTGVAAFGRRSVVLDGGEHVDAELVVFATGWTQDASFLGDSLREQVVRGGRYHLYRHILPPSERRVGFVGYASSAACPLTSEIAAHWLSQCFLGGIPLPSRVEMDAEIARVLGWSRRTFPSRAEGVFIGPYVPSYVDQLLGDMGLRTKRSPMSLVGEYTEPVWPQRYRSVADERRQRRASLRQASAPEHRRGIQA
ncbi:MAG TPA: FAD-dependent oxidoreductase [Gemmatimonadaceae bacterium]|nr:FAD-dependent oxidoreductase [Gemmatimonadaceae bacterium]